MFLGSSMSSLPLASSSYTFAVVILSSCPVRWNRAPSFPCHSRRAGIVAGTWDHGLAGA